MATRVKLVFQILKKSSLNSILTYEENRDMISLLKEEIAWALSPKNFSSMNLVFLLLNDGIMKISNGGFICLKNKYGKLQMIFVETFE